MTFDDSPELMDTEWDLRVLLAKTLKISLPNFLT